MSTTATATAYGELTCRVVEDDAGEPPELLVILCHGFGAPGTDLVPLAEELRASSLRLRKGVRFVFPAAPLSLAEAGLPDGRAWWHLDVPGITEAIERGELRDLRSGYPDGAIEARDQLKDTVLASAEEAGLPLSSVVLGGFSQGAMIATDVAMRLPEPPAGLCVLSGTLIAEEEWRELAAARGTMPVLQSHGRFDPILPFQGAIWLRDVLAQAGLPVEFLDFNGVHTIPFEALQRMAAMMEQALAE